MSLTSNLRQLFAGRWQIPVALLAAASVGLSLWNMRPSDKPIDLPRVMADVSALMDQGRFYDATNAAADLLQRAANLTPTQVAELHDYLSRVIFESELEKPTPEPENVRLIDRHLRSALAGGVPLDATHVFRRARVDEWLGSHPLALEGYRQRIEMSGSADEIRLARQGIVRLLDGRPEFLAERTAQLRALLDDNGLADDYLWWALREELSDRLDAGDADSARTALLDFGSRLRRSDLAAYHDVLLAETYLAEGRTQEAEPIIRAIDAFLEDGGETRDDLDRFAPLKAALRRLSGELHLALGNAEQAARDFNDALLRDPPPRDFVLAVIGSARADLARNDDTVAIQTFRQAAEQIAGWPNAVAAARGLEKIADAAEREARLRRQAGRTAAAADLLEAGLCSTHSAEFARQKRLVEMLADWCAEAALQAETLADAAELHRRSARWHERAAELADLREPMVSDHLWAAADHYDQLGSASDVRRVLDRFVRGRSFDPRMPAALLRLGSANEVDGLFQPAIDAYERLFREFPELPEAAMARVLNAGCLISLGESEYPAAERLLTDLLEDGAISPRSIVFRDALRALCDLLYYQGRYADAVARLETLLEYHPEDPGLAQTRFMLADSYRKSAIQWRSAAANVHADARQRERVAELARDRLRRAHELFNAVQIEVTAALASADDDAARVLRAYQRMSMFYRAECLADLGDPDSIEAALAVYRQAAAEYEREVPVLSAQVQTANLHLRLGRVTEAARALERARWLLANMTDAAFDRARQEGEPWGRAEWQSYLGSLASSHLFAGAFTSARQ